MKSNTFIALAAAAIITSSCTDSGYKIDEIGIEVTPSENREYSFTDKKSGYWYGRTHLKDLDWYSGWNVAKRRILADYSISVDDKVLDINDAECTFYPDRLVRKWNNAVETFRMVDNLPVLHIDLQTDAAQTSISLDRNLIKESHTTEDASFYSPYEDPDKLIMLGRDRKKGFVLTYGSTEEECRALHSEFLAHGQELIEKRRDTRCL